MKIFSDQFSQEWATYERQFSAVKTASDMHVVQSQWAHLIREEERQCKEKIYSCLKNNVSRQEFFVLGVTNHYLNGIMLRYQCIDWNNSLEARTVHANDDWVEMPRTKFESNLREAMADLSEMIK